MLVANLCLGVLEKALNQLLRLDPNYQHALAPLIGKVIKIEMQGLPFSYYLQFDEEQLRLAASVDLIPDATLRGSPIALFKSAVISRLSTTTDPAVFRGEIEIEGDVHLGNEVTRLIQSLDFDWEGGFSYFIGEVPAHYLWRGAKGGTQYLNSAKNRLLHQITTYFQEERPYLPSPDVLEDLYQDIQDTQMAVERAEARIERLMRTTEE